MTDAFACSYVAVVGIDRYGGGIPALGNAVRDAEGFADLLVAKHGYETLRLTTGATAARLTQLFEELANRVGPEDRLIFYFAGHGIAPGAENPGALVCEDAERLESEKGMLRMDELRRQLGRLRCRHLLVILDCCYAGSFRWAGTTRNAEILPRLLYREQYLRFVEDRAAQVLTSAAYDEQAHDSLGGRGGGRHSPFAAALFEALEGQADIMPPGGDGVITATELYLYLRDRVELATLEEGLRQTPGLCQLETHDKGEFVFEVPGRLVDLLPAPQLTGELNPYSRLVPVRAAELLFGRSAVVVQAAESATERRLTVLVGPPLVGKTSLLLAGLLPALEPDWRIVGPCGCGEGLAALAAPVATDRQLLVVDGFEELTGLPEVEQASWREGLGRFLVGSGAARHLVLVLRSTHETQVCALLGLDAAMWTAGKIEIGALDYEARRTTIFGPARQRALFVTDDLADRLLADAGTGNGAVALLSLSLHSIYLQYLESGRNDRRLVVEDYQAVGKLERLVHEAAKSLQDELAAEIRLSLHRLVFRMADLRGKSLVGRQVPPAELESADPAESQRTRQCLRRLLAASLVVPEGQGFEPVHAEVPRAFEKLGAWPEAERERRLALQRWVAATSAHWLAERSALSLLTPDDPRIDALLELAREPGSWLSVSEKRFIRASQEAHIAARRWARRRMITGSVLALVAIALGSIGWTLNDLSQVRRAAAQASSRMALEPEEGLAAAAAAWTRLKELESRSWITGLQSEFAMARAELLRALFGNLTTLRGYRGTVGEAVKMAPLVAGSDDGQIVVISDASEIYPPRRSRIQVLSWEADRYRKIDERWLDGWVQCLEITASGKNLMAVTQDFVAIYELNDAGAFSNERRIDLAKTLFADTACSAARLKPNGSGAFLGSTQGQILHLSMADGALESWADNVGGRVADLEIGGSGELLLVAIENDNSTLKALLGRELSEPAVSEMVVSQVGALTVDDSGRIVTGHEDGTVTIWSAGFRVASKQLSAVSIVALVETTVPGRFVVGNQLGELIAFDFVGGSGEESLIETSRLSLFRRPVMALAPTPDGGVIAASGSEPVRCWQPAGLASLETMVVSPTPYDVGLAADSTGTRLWAFGKTTVAEWELSGGVWAGPQIAFGGDDYFPGVLRIGALAPKRGLVALLPEFRSADKHLRLASFASPKAPPLILEGEFINRLPRVKFSPSENLVALIAADEPQRILIWPTEQLLREPLKLEEAKEGMVETLAFSPDETRLAVGSYRSRCVRISTLATSSSTIFECGENPPQSVAWDAKTGMLAVGWLDGRISVGIPGENSEHRRLDGHRENVFRLRFDPSGRWLISASVDGRLIIRDTITWEIVGNVKEGLTRDFMVYDFVAAPDGAWLALLGFGDRVMTIWPLDPEQWVEKAKQLAGAIGSPEAVEAEGTVPGES